MKMKYSLLTLASWCFMFILSISFTSCGDDSEEPDMTEAANERFLGDYVGEVTCGPVLGPAINDPALAFSITEASPAQDDRVSVNFPNLTIPLELVGVVSGNNITMEETTVEGVMIDTPIALTFDARATGNANLAGNSLDATIDLVGFVPGTTTELASDRCTIIATKQ